MRLKMKREKQGAYSNRSNQIQTQFEPVRNHLEPKLEIHVSSHAACDSEGGSNSRSYRHDELNNQLPSVLFCFCTPKKNNFFAKHYFFRGER